MIVYTHSILTKTMTADYDCKFTGHLEGLKSAQATNIKTL